MLQLSKTGCESTKATIIELRYPNYTAYCALEL